MERTTRRKWLAAGSAVAAGAALDGLAIEPNWLEVTRHEVSLPGLPRHLDGYVVAQITDAHLTELGWLEEQLVTAVRAASPQLIVLTGDLVDSRERFAALRELCGQLARCSDAVVATLGNWEHWGGVSTTALDELYSDAGVRLLVNDGTVVGGVEVFGTDDSTAGLARSDGLGASRAEAELLLTHSPAYLDRLAERRAPTLALAGHTHGGQVRLGRHLAPVTPPGSGRFVGGWYQVPTGRAYVSRGTGTSIAPARFTCRPELPLFTLRQG